MRTCYLVFLAVLLLSGCEPYNLERKTFPTCVSPKATIGVSGTGLDLAFFVDNPQGDIGLAGWDFGDGANVNRVGLRVIYNYEKAGTYTVRLNLVNTCDDTFTVTRQITVR